MNRLLAFASPLRWWRFARHERGQRALLAEAALQLARAAFAIRFLPFDRAIRSGAVRLGEARPVDAAGVARAVRWAAAVLPFRAVCLQQGVACQAMLRSRGADAKLHYGMAAGTERMEAHVWVTVDGSIVIGEEEAARFRPVATFPD